ncbi:MAG: cytochrome C oxidase subunit IV family protein [Oceanicaulis sp.]
MTERTKALPGGTVKIAVSGLALLVLLLATVGISYLDVGWLNIAANLGIAGLKAAIVVWVFMELSEVRSAIRLFALGVIAWIAIMFVFTAADYFQRTGI